MWHNRRARDRRAICPVCEGALEGRQSRALCQTDQKKAGPPLGHWKHRSRCDRIPGWHGC
eukprot:6998448-Pyramimonas_sp.AAC.1